MRSIYPRVLALFAHANQLFIGWGTGVKLWFNIIERVRKPFSEFKIKVNLYLFYSLSLFLYLTTCFAGQSAPTLPWIRPSMLNPMSFQAGASDLWTPLEDWAGLHLDPMDGKNWQRPSGGKCLLWLISLLPFIFCLAHLHNNGMALHPLGNGHYKDSVSLLFPLFLQLHLPISALLPALFIPYFLPPLSPLSRGRMGWPTTIMNNNCMNNDPYEIIFVMNNDSYE